MDAKFVIYGDTTITYQNSEVKNQQVIDKIIAWCKKYDIGSGESLCQRDEGIMEAPYLVADIIDDILEFKYPEDEF